MCVKEAVICFFLNVIYFSKFKIGNPVIILLVDRLKINIYIFLIIFIPDVLKNTSKSNPDNAALEQALAALREVMTHINEDKRKAEGQVTLFNIFNDIDNCPVS